MSRILGSILFFALTFLHAGSVTATVDTQEVTEGDSVFLTITITGKDIDSLASIEEIAGRKVISSQPSTKFEYVSINGVSKMEKIHNLTLEFRPDTNMTIPGFATKVDGELKQTKAIYITVLKSVTGMRRATKNFSLDLTLNKEKAFMGEPILATVLFKRRTRVDVMEVSYNAPAFKEFLSKQIGEGKGYQKGRYTIQELTYLLTPKRAGVLTLEPARAKIAQRSRERQRGGWYVDVPVWTQISSSELTIEILNIKEKYDIVGSYTLKDTIDVQKVKANKPVTLKIELAGKGTLDDFAGIEFDIDSVTMYANDAKIESTLVGTELQSKYAKSFVFIADHDFTIPSKSVRVYDYKTGKVKVLKTKAYKIEIDGGVKNIATPIVHTKVPVQAVVVSSKSNKSWLMLLPSFLALLLAFILGMLVVLVWQYIPSVRFGKWKRKSISFTYEDAFKTLYPKITENAEVEVMVRKLYAMKNGNKNVKIDTEVLKELLRKYK